MNFNKNKNISPLGIINLGIIKPIAVAVLFVVIIGITTNFATVPVIEKPAKEQMWSGVTTVKVLFPGSMYPDIKDVSDNPALAGIEIVNTERKTTVKNLNKDFITVEFKGIAEIVAPGKTVSGPLSKEISVSFPDSRAIRGGPNIYYFDLGI